MIDWRERYLFGKDSRDIAEALKCIEGSHCNVPRPGESIPWDKVYKRLEIENLIKWHNVHPGFASLSDHYVLTASGKKALDKYRDYLDWLSTPARVVRKNPRLR